MKNLKKLLTALLLILSLQSNATIFHIDPVHGNDTTGDGSENNPWKTVEYVINNNLIESMSYVTPYDSTNPQLVVKNPGAPVKPGDTLYLYNGIHGEINLVNYVNPDYITIKNAPGHYPVVKSIHIQGGSKWRFEGLTVSPELFSEYGNGKIVFFESHDWQGPVSKVEIRNCEIFSSTVAWADSSDWLTKASDGIVIWADSVTVENNIISNIHFGIIMLGDYITVSGNTISNFSADGIRLNGSYDIVEKNIIKNCYDVDDNHDDGIQSFTTGGLTVNNNIVRQNIILNYEDPNQPLLGPLQGIGCFDGPYENWTVENNLIIVNHWHGISFYGLKNGRIVNNTVLDPDLTDSIGPCWIKIDNMQDYPSENCVVANNIINSISTTANTLTQNNLLLTDYQNYDSNFVDYTSFDFHLKANSEAIDAACDSLSPSIDLDDNTRPSGIHSDIGCYEYIPVSTIHESILSKNLKIYPNPVATNLYITGEPTTSNIKILNLQSKIIKSFSKVSIPGNINVSNLESGIYIIKIKIKGYLKTILFIKK